MAPADQLKAVDDIDMPFTMTALETIINFGQILEIKEEKPAAPRGRHFDPHREPTIQKPAHWNEMSKTQRRHWLRHKLQTK